MDDQHCFFIVKWSVFSNVLAKKSQFLAVTELKTDCLSLSIKTFKHPYRQNNLEELLLIILSFHMLTFNNSDMLARQGLSSFSQKETGFQHISDLYSACNPTCGKCLWKAYFAKATGETQYVCSLVEGTQTSKCWVSTGTSAWQGGLGKDVTGLGQIKGLFNQKWGQRTTTA